MTEREVDMSHLDGRHGDHEGAGGHRASWRTRGLLPVFLVLLLVPAISVLKVPQATTGTVPCDCETCHTSPHAGGFACGSCHGIPPANGSHQVHYDSAPLEGTRYGDAANRSTSTNYIFDCGNCHPLDSAKHANGTLEVELYNASATADTLKAKNPATAAYNPTGKTCSNVYCHSGITVTSGPVGLPLTPPPNLTYAPYEVNISRDYKITPAWGTTGTFTTCTECHGFAPTTSYPQVQAMVGDTHGWLDDYGYYDGHMYNMGFGGVPCATCHYNSVNHSDGWPASPPGNSRVGPPYDDFYFYKTVGINSRVLHVNGRSDIAFDTVNGYQGGYSADLGTATYDAPTKTCSNVSCHLQQTTVTWGSPYRWWNSDECNACHQY